MSEDRKALTLRLDHDVYDHLRQLGFDERTSITALIVAAIQATYPVTPESETNDD